jgi:hypothetical protein
MPLIIKYFDVILYHLEKCMRFDIPTALSVKVAAVLVLRCIVGVFGLSFSM